MPYKKTRTDGYVHLDWYGVLTDEDIVSLGQDLPAIASELGYAPHVLHTFDRVAGARVRPWTVFQHALRHKDVPIQNPVKSAWVAAHPDVQRMGKLFQELNRNPQLEVELFETAKAAKAWLKRGANRASRKPRRCAAG